MSADPVTMMIISGAVQAYGTYSEIQSSKVQSKIEQERYELKMKAANLDGLTQENNRKEEAEKTKKHNLAILSGSGYNDDSMSFLNIQKQVDIHTQKDITTIRLNTGAQLSDYSLASQAAHAQRKSDQFGGWVSIAGTGLSTKAKVDAYKPKGGGTTYRWTGYGKSGYGRNPNDIM
jgi:hypothetical protein